MDQILSQLVGKQNAGKHYNPAASYVQKRRIVVDWMCEMGEDLKFEAETIHHSIQVFDSYF